MQPPCSPAPITLLSPVNRPMKPSSLRPHISTASSADSWAATCEQQGRCAGQQAGGAGGVGWVPYQYKAAAAYSITNPSPICCWRLTGSRNALFSVAGAAWHATVCRIRPNRRDACGKEAQSGSQMGYKGSSTDAGSAKTTALSIMPCPQSPHLVAHVEVRASSGGGRRWHGACSARHLGHPPLGWRILVHVASRYALRAAVGPAETLKSTTAPP